MLTVCNYHYIRPSYNAKYPSIFGVTPYGFKHQIKLLKGTGEIIKPSTLLNNYEEVFTAKENYILITFDDGLKEQYDYALPILDELEASAIFFVNSSNIKQNQISTVHKIHLLRSEISSNEIYKLIEQKTNVSLSSKDKDVAKQIYKYDDIVSAGLKYLFNYKIDFEVQEKIINEVFEEYFDEEKMHQMLYMTIPQIKALAELGYLGSHTHNHYPLALISDEAKNFELSESKSYFETLTNTKIEMLAYPYGTKEAVNDKVATIAKQVGYKFGFTTTKGVNTTNKNNLLLNRFDCNDLIGGKNYKE